MKKNTWITTASHIDYQNPFMRIVKNTVIRPNGYKAPYYVLERPTFSIIVPYTENKETYLVEQYRYPIKQNSWEFPMGNVQTQDPLQAAQRELKEETGLTAKKWEKVASWAIAPGHNNQFAHLFLAIDLVQEEAEPEPGELLTIKKMALSEVGDLIAQRVIIDGPTICAFYLLELYLKRHRL